jgi:hypothetical protein
MARIRTIKPEFFTDEDMADLPPLHRLLFIGLWTEADKRGRLGDRPRALRVRILPYDGLTDEQFDGMLDDLHNAGFIVRYEAAGVQCIAVRTFEKHQRPHPKELDQGLPDPPIDAPKRTKPGNFTAQPGNFTARNYQPDSNPVETRGEGKGKEGKEILENGGGERKTDPPPPPEPAAAFFAWFQAKREEVGLVREKLPNPSALGRFFSEALMELNGDEDRLREAVYRFAEDKHWQQATPPVPFNAFKSEWRKYAPPRTAHNAA